MTRNPDGGGERRKDKQITKQRAITPASPQAPRGERLPEDLIGVCKNDCRN